MTEADQREELIAALYAAAADPGRHEAFLDAFSAVLASEDAAGAKAWLEPHLETAISIFEKLNFAGLLERSPEKIVEQLSEPAVVVTQLGEIVAANSAWHLVGPGQHLNELTTNVSDRSNIKAVLQSLHVILEDRTKPLRISDQSVFPFLAFRRLPSVDERSTNGARYLVSATGLSWPAALASFLSEQFQLSDNELEIIESIVSGDTLAAIAESTGRTRETIKSHTKSIYAKLNITGREDLVRLILQLHRLFGTTKTKPSDPQTRSIGSSVHLSDGRRIYWQQKGAKNGRRLLFLHGLSLGYHFSDAFQLLLEEHDLSLICVERPGYGRSDPPRNWKRGLEEWIDLFPELQRELGLGNSPIITQTGGIMLATAAAYHHPALVSGICAFAAGVPIVERRRLAEYPPQIRLISRAAWLSPSILRFVMMNGARYFNTPHGQERLIDRTYANGSVDSEALKETRTRENVKRSMQMIADGGFDGFVADNLHMFSDWSRFPLRTKCEIAYLNGSEDQICPIAWAREFANRVPTLTVAEAKGAGNLMMHTHPQRCIEHLLGCLNRFDSNRP